MPFRIDQLRWNINRTFLTIQSYEAHYQVHSTDFVVCSFIPMKRYVC